MEGKREREQNPWPYKYSELKECITGVHMFFESLINQLFLKVGFCTSGFACVCDGQPHVLQIRTS